MTKTNETPDPRSLLTLADGTTVRADEMWERLATASAGYCDALVNIGGRAYVLNDRRLAGASKEPWTDATAAPSHRRVYPPPPDERTASIREEMARLPLTPQQSPFVARRPDGFVGVEVSVTDQLTPAEARALAVQLLILARAAEEPAAVRAEAPGWIVWERATDEGRPHIRAIDLSEQKAHDHVKYLKAEARHGREPEPDLLIEETRLDHLYAAALLAALRKRGTEGTGG